MRSLGWDLHIIQYDWFLYKKRRLGHRPAYIQREDHVKKGKFSKFRAYSNEDNAPDLMDLKKEWEGVGALTSMSEVKGPLATPMHAGKDSSITRLKRPFALRLRKGNDSTVAIYILRRCTLM